MLERSVQKTVQPWEVMVKVPRSSQRKLGKNYSLDSFYLAEILIGLDKADDIINLFSNYNFGKKLDSASIYNFIGTAHDIKGEYYKALGKFIALYRNM